MLRAEAIGLPAVTAELQCPECKNGKIIEPPTTDFDSENEPVCDFCGLTFALEVASWIARIVMSGCPVPPEPRCGKEPTMSLYSAMPVKNAAENGTTAQTEYVQSSKLR